MSNINDTTLREELQQYGVPEHSVKSLQHQSPDLLDYLDLIEGSSSSGVSPDYVAESQGKPLLYVVNRMSLAQFSTKEDDYKHLRHALACKGQRAYLALLHFGELHVVPVDAQGELPWQVYKAGSDQALNFFPRLTLGHYDGQGDAVRGDYIFDEMFELLSQVADQLVEVGLKKSDVLSLVGRALFFRFLLDRKIISDKDVNAIAQNAATLEDCFRTAENTVSTCQWLDRTFNGDFLALSGDLLDTFKAFDKHAQSVVFLHLSAIARAYKAIGYSSYQLRLKDQQDGSLFDFDFAHVPVGLLSQVHEKFAWKWDYADAGSTSVHYTPRNIAATMVEEVFDGLASASGCRVLDPACGAGVFLVLAFRRLYRERWKVHNIRPGTEEIRSILMKQITGFDISESALKLAALSLYLTAIELDPEPVPPQKLKFNNLRDTVLFNFRDSKKDAAIGPVPGSLYPEVTRGFEGQFDIVLSNPPWTSLEGDELQPLSDSFNAISQRVIRAIGTVEAAVTYRNPDRVPDLPFLWKAIEWCKPGGRIAMALHARLLLKQSDIASHARKTLFQLLTVNGILNGSNLSDTPVWPDMNQPFILLFASNTPPALGHVLHLITPHNDVTLNNRGEMWVDSQSAIPVEVAATFEEPWLWKALTVGTILDVEIVRKIKAANAPNMETYWKNLGLISSNGYQPKPDQRQKDASHLKGLPNLTSQQQFRFHVQTSLLNIFTANTLCRPRKRKVYYAPLMLIRESPRADRKKGRALLSLEDVAYNESFHGYSACGHSDADILVRYVHLFVHSNIWIHYALLTSPKFGAERRKIYKADFDNCPVMPFEILSPEKKNRVMTLSERLLKEDISVFEDIDTFFAELYDLDSLDMEVIKDTLEVSFPYRSSRQRASSPPIPSERETFRNRLTDLLRPFFQVVGQEPRIEYWQSRTNSNPPSMKSSYITLLITARDELPSLDVTLWMEIVRIAEQTGATRIFQEVDGSLLVAILNQYRYWTPSRARLCAAEIVRQYIDIFED